MSRDGYASRAGDLIVLRPWEKRLLGELFARRPDGRYRHRVALIGLPRKNGKSAISSGMALDGLLFCGKGTDVFSCAGDKDQARIVFEETKRMVQAEPEVADLCTVMRDTIAVPSYNSVYRVLSAEAYTKEGLNPSRVLFDEVHVQPDDELWNVMSLAMAARRDPLMIGITTAGVMTDTSGRDSLCYRLWQHGCDIAAGTTTDPSFYMAWWGAPTEADHRDPEVWAAANPGYGDLIDPEDFASAVLRTPEAEFRTKRLNQWVATATAWLPQGAWEACADNRQPLADGDTVYLGFDGSKGRIDATALVAVRPGNPPFVDLIAIWERPEGAPDDWEIPVDEVEAMIRATCKRFRVREILYDPHLWQTAMGRLGAEGLPVVEFPQTPERMIGATQRFYEAVLVRAVGHSGNHVLAQHLRNAVLKTSEKGSRIVKETKWSGRRIDAAVAAVMAFDVASQINGASRGREWLESLAPPCKGCGKPMDRAGDLCSRCWDGPAATMVAAEPDPPKPAAPAKWSPTSPVPERTAPDQTRAAMDMLRQMPRW